MEGTESNDHFDFVIIGTSLVHAILAAALATAGRSVVHQDNNIFYGEDNACLSPPLSHETLPSQVIDFEIIKDFDLTDSARARDYNLELSPQLLYTSSTMIELLRDLRISEYVQFKALRSFYIHRGGSLSKVPSSKEDIFTSKSVPLLVKRRLMKFVKFSLQYKDDPIFEANRDRPLREFVESQFKLEAEILDAVTCSLAQSRSTMDSVEQAIPAIEQHLKSLGIFGDFPVVVPMYGSACELIQGFCRKAAVKGCTYILGQTLTASESNPSSLSLASGHRISARHMIRATSHDHRYKSHKIVVIEGGLEELMQGQEAICITFVPENGEHNVVHCQIHTHGIGVCPDGQAVIYLHTDGRARQSDLQVSVSKLLKESKHRIVCDIEYNMGQNSDSNSYDQAIIEARRIFYKYVPKNTPFLPREAEDESISDEVAL